MLAKIDIGEKIAPVSSTARGKRVNRKEKTERERHFQRQFEEEKKKAKKQKPDQLESTQTDLANETKARQDGDDTGSRDADMMPDGCANPPGSLINIIV